MTYIVKFKSGILRFVWIRVYPAIFLCKSFYFLVR